jgi:hypothetical protein
MVDLSNEKFARLFLLQERTLSMQIVISKASERGTSQALTLPCLPDKMVSTVANWNNMNYIAPVPAQRDH